MTRVLVCGSRAWTDGDAIRARLATLGRGSTVVTGGARGADRLAETIARGLGLDVDVLPADWKRYGRRAGYVRNVAMLDTGPELVLAFQLDGSRGTQQTIDLARARGIPVVVERRGVA